MRLDSHAYAPLTSLSLIAMGICPGRPDLAELELGQPPMSSLCGGVHLGVSIGHCQV